MDLSAKLKCQAEVYHDRGEKLIKETEDLDERFIALGVITGDYLEEITEVIRRGYPTGDLTALVQAYVDLQSLGTQNLQALFVLCENLGIQVVQMKPEDGETSQFIQTVEQFLTDSEGGDSADGEDGNGSTVRRDSE